MVVSFLERWRDDLRLAVRGLARARGFTAAAVLTLAIGIAGATAMFALVEGVLLRPLPVPATGPPGRRVEGDPGGRLRALALPGARHRRHRQGEPDVRERRRRQLLRPPFAFRGGRERSPRARISGASVTGDFFRVLGVEPILGRVLSRADDVVGAENVLVITHGLWQRRYGGLARRDRAPGDA